MKISRRPEHPVRRGMFSHPSAQVTLLSGRQIMTADLRQRRRRTARPQHHQSQRRPAGRQQRQIRRHRHHRHSNTYRPRLPGRQRHRLCLRPRLQRQQRRRIHRRGSFGLGQKKQVPSGGQIHRHCRRWQCRLPRRGQMPRTRHEGRPQ